MASAARLNSAAFSSTSRSTPLRQHGSFAPCVRRCAVPLTVRAAYGDLAKFGGGKKWEHTEVNKNGKPVKVKMHVKKGDLVQVIAGKDKGTVAEIERVLTKKGEIIVKGVNIKLKNEKPKAENEQGQQVRKEFPVHHSNVMHYSKEKEVRSRVGHKVNDAGKKVRYLIKTGEVID